MKAKFIGKKSMGYKPNKIYVLATTFNNDYWWVVDINRKGKPVPYSSTTTFLNNWEVLEIPFRDMEERVFLEQMKEGDKQ